MANTKKKLPEMQRSKSFTSIAFEQKQKAAARKASPTRQSRPKPEWNDYLTDPNRFKVAESAILKKKKMLVSKHNILAPEYQPTKLKSALSTPRSVDNSYASSHKLHSSSTSSHTQNRSIADAEASSMSKKPSQEKKDSLDLLTTPSSDEELDESEDEEEEEEDNDYLDLDEDSDEEGKKYSSSPTKRDISSAHLESDEDDVSNTLESYFAQSKTSRKTSKAKKSSTKKENSKSPVCTTPSSQAELTAQSHSRPRSTWGTTGRSSLVAGASSTSITTAAASPRHHSYASPVAKKRPSIGHKLDASPSIVSQSPTTPPHHTAKFIEKADCIADEDLLDIAQNIDHLQQELRLYEELAGKKSILDAEELQLILGTDENGTMNVESLNQKTVIRYLVSLVCQTMTYTLQSEVKQQQLETELHTMQSKMDEVLRLVTQQQQTNAAYSRYVLTAVPSTVTNPALAVAPAVSLLSSNPETSAPSSSAAPMTLSPSPYKEEEVSTPLVNSAVEAGNGMFYGTSASDWLFMAAKGTPRSTHTATPQQQQVKESSSAYHTPVPQYEFQLSPETAADLATRTYDMYLHQQQQQQQQQRVSFPNETRVKAVSGDNDTASMNDDTSSHWDDQYDEMVDRLSFPSSSVTHKTHKIPSVAAHQRHQQPPQEGVSIVVPNADLPTPAKPSPHPFQRNLFPNSPPAAKKIYDASLGNYSLIDTYDN